jgi:hypothetical protein
MGIKEEGANVKNSYNHKSQNKNNGIYGSYYPIYQYPKRWDWRNVRGWDWTTPVRGQIGEKCRYLACYDVLECCLRIWGRIYRDSSDLRIDELSVKSWIETIGTTNGGGLESLIKIADEIVKKGLPITSIDEGIVRDHFIQYKLLKKSNFFKKEGELDLNLDNSTIIESNNDNIVKEWVHHYGPVITTIQTSGNFTEYQEGVIPNAIGDGPFHVVSIFGYDDKKQYWICKNTYGKYWGEDGWFRIAYKPSNVDKNGFAEFGFLAFVPPKNAWSPYMVLQSVEDVYKKAY